MLQLVLVTEYSHFPNLCYRKAAGLHALKHSCTIILIGLLFSISYLNNIWDFLEALFGFSVYYTKDTELKCCILKSFEIIIICACMLGPQYDMWLD